MRPCERVLWLFLAPLAFGCLQLISVPSRARHSLLRTMAQRRHHRRLPLSRYSNTWPWRQCVCLARTAGGPLPRRTFARIVATSKWAGFTQRRCGQPFPPLQAAGSSR